MGFLGSWWWACGFLVLSVVLPELWVVEPMLPLWRLWVRVCRRCIFSSIVRCRFAFPCPVSTLVVLCWEALGMHYGVLVDVALVVGVRSFVEVVEVVGL